MDARTFVCVCKCAPAQGRRWPAAWREHCRRKSPTCRPASPAASDLERRTQQWSWRLTTETFQSNSDTQHPSSQIKPRPHTSLSCIFFLVEISFTTADVFCRTTSCLTDVRVILCSPAVLKHRNRAVSGRRHEMRHIRRLRDEEKKVSVIINSRLSL